MKLRHREKWGPKIFVTMVNVIMSFFFNRWKMGIQRKVQRPPSCILLEMINRFLSHMYSLFYSIPLHTATRSCFFAQCCVQIPLLHKIDRTFNVQLSIGPAWQTKFNFNYAKKQFQVAVCMYIERCSMCVHISLPKKCISCLNCTIYLVPLRMRIYESLTPNL